MDSSVILPSFSQLESVDPPVYDICKYLEQVVRAPQLDHVTLQNIFRALQKWLESACNHNILDSGIVLTLAKVCDTLLQQDYSKADVLTSLLDLLFVVEDISEAPRGKEACGCHFISRLLALIPTKLASVNLRRAAVETLCALITRCPANQQAVLDRRTDCLLLFNFLLPKCGDFQLQASIAETFYRISKRDPQLIESIKDESFKEALQTLHEKKRPDLLTEIRNLVVLLNESMGPFRSVYSFMSERVIIDGRNVTAAEEKWVDFGKTLFSFHALSEPLSSPGNSADNCGAQIFDILYVDIIDIRKSTPEQLEIVVHEQQISQSSMKDQKSVGRHMCIQLSFAQEDLSSMVKHVLPRIHPIKTKKDDLSSQSGGSSPRSHICRSSQGIMIPLRIHKGDVQTSIAPSSDQNSPKFVEPVSYSNIAVRKTFLRNGNDNKESKIGHPEDLATGELRIVADAKITKDLSPCSQIIEETLASLGTDVHSPVLNCEEGGALSASAGRWAFKTPADRPRSNTGADSQVEATKLNGGTPMVVEPAKMEVKPIEAQACGIPDASGNRNPIMKFTQSAKESNLAERDKQNVLEGNKQARSGESGQCDVVKDQKKVIGADNVVGGQEDVDGDTVAIAVHNVEEKAAENPAWDTFDRKTRDFVAKKTPKALLVKATKSLTGVKRPQLPCSDLLNDVISMAEGPLTRVQSHLKSKRVRLADDPGTQDSFEPFSEVPNWHPKAGGGRKKGLCAPAGEVLVKKSVSRNHKQAVVRDTAGADCELAGTRGRKSKRKIEDRSNTQNNINEDAEEVHPEAQDGAQKRLKLTETTDPIESDIEKVEEQTVKSAPKKHKGVASRTQQVGKRPRGRPRKEKVIITSCKTTKPILDVDNQNVFSFSEELDADDGNRPQEKKHAAMSSLKERKVVEERGMQLDTSPHDRAEKEAKSPTLRSDNSYQVVGVMEKSVLPRRVQAKEKTAGSIGSRILRGLGISSVNKVPSSPPEAVRSRTRKHNKSEEVLREKSPLPPLQNTDDGVIEPPLPSQKATPKRSNSSIRGMGLGQALGTDYDSAYSISPSEGMKSRVRKSILRKEDQKTSSPRAEADVEAVSPHQKINIPIISSGEEMERVNIPQRVSPKLVRSSTKRRGGLQKSGANLDILKPFTRSPVKKMLGSPCQSALENFEKFVGACSPAGSIHIMDTPPVSKHRKQKKFLVCSPEQGKRKPQTRTAKEKVATDNSKRKNAPRSTGKEYEKLPSLTNRGGKLAPKTRIRAAEPERDVDIYYSTSISPCPAAAHTRRASVPREKNRKILSYSSKSDEAADESASEDELWGRTSHRKKGDLFKRHNAFEKIEDTGVADSTPDDSASAEDDRPPSILKGKACKPRVQPIKPFSDLKVTCTASPYPEESDDDTVSPRNSTHQPCSTPELPLRESSSVCALKGMKSRRAPETTDEDENDGLGRAVALVQEMLENLRRKVQLQTQEKTKQVLATVLKNIESDADAFNTRIDQDMDDYVKFCKRKLKTLEAKRQAQIQKGGVLQEKFANEMKEYQQECKHLLSKVKRTEEELKVIANAQRAAHTGLFNELQGSAQQKLEDADKKISEIRKAAKRLNGLKDILQKFK